MRVSMSDRGGLELCGRSLFQPHQPPPQKSTHPHGAKFANELYRKLHRGRPAKPPPHALPKPPPPQLDFMTSPVRLPGEPPSLIRLPKSGFTRRRSYSRELGAVKPAVKPLSASLLLPPRAALLTNHGLSRSTSDLSESTEALQEKARPSSAGDISARSSSSQSENHEIQTSQLEDREIKANKTAVREIRVKLPDLASTPSGKDSRMSKPQESPLDRYKYHLVNDAKRTPLKRTPTNIDLEQAVNRLRVVVHSTPQQGVIMAPIPSPEPGSSAKASSQGTSDSESDSDREDSDHIVTRPGSTPGPKPNHNISYSMFNFARLDGETVIVDQGDTTTLPRLDPQPHVNVVTQGNRQGSARVNLRPFTDLDLSSLNSQERMAALELTPRTTENSLNARSEYSRNLERNWLKQYTELKEKKRKKKREEKLFQWVKKRVKKEDEFFMAFYSSSDDEDDSTPKRCHSAAPSYRPPSADSSTGSNLLRYASLDVLVSDSDHETDELLPDYAWVLKDNQLEEIEVWNKMRKKHQRQHHRYRHIQIPDQEALQIGDVGVRMEMLDTLTDKEIRAMRLRLSKEEHTRNASASDFVLGDHQSIRALAAEILSGLKNLKKKPKSKSKKKKKPRSLTDSDYDRYERRTPLPSLRDRFMQDFSHLLTSRKKKTEVEVKPNETNEEDTPKKPQTELFFSSVSNDEELLNRLVKTKRPSIVGPSLVHGPARSDTSQLDAKSKKTPRILESREQLFGSATDEEEEEVEYGRGMLNKTAIRRNSLPTIEKPDIISYKVMRRKSLTKSELLQRRKSMKSGSVTEDAISRRMSCMSGRGSPPPSAMSHTSSAFMFEDVFIDLNDRSKRPLSARRMCRDETEIDLHDLTAGLQFPAKEVKIKIVERRRRRQRRKKRMLKAQRAAEAAREQSLPPDSDTDSEECEGEEDSGTSSPQLPSFLKKRKSLHFNADSPFVSALLSQHKMSDIRMKYSNEELDALLDSLSDLFYDMKDCRYLRWRPRDWAIIQRLLELELLE